MCWKHQNLHSHAPQLVENQYRWFDGSRTVAERNHFHFCYCYNEPCSTKGGEEGLKEARVSVHTSCPWVVSQASRGSTQEKHPRGAPEKCVHWGQKRSQKSKARQMLQTISLAEARSMMSDVFKSLGQTVELSAESGSHRPESSERKLEAF